MAIDAFLKVEGLEGESADEGHAKEIDVLAWSWGMVQTGTTHRGTGGGAGKVNVQDLTVTKYVDKSSPNLMLACCTGKHFKEANLAVRKAGDTPLEYLKLKLSDVLVANVSTGGTQGAELVTENVTLNFAKFELEYVPQKPDGSGDAAVTVGFDVARNVKL